MDSVEGLFRGWYDVLRTYDGKGIQYDRSGNPVSYDGKTFTWNGKLLTKVTAADGSYTEFSYDANGIRTQKRQFTSDGTLAYDVDYVWQDGLLTHQNMIYYLRITSKNETRVVEIPFSAKFVYDESNTPVGCLVNGEAALAFVRNLQGDIIAVVNQEGTALLEYSYDPWGKVTITQNGENLTEQEAAIIAVLCPFAYRGYNYDYTTGLYYLQSRYYNPEWGRFLNVDDTNILLSTQGENLGANLFAYCNNNPVNQVDYTGRWGADVHSGVFEENMTGKKGYNTSLLYGYYVPYRSHARKSSREYYGTFYWAKRIGYSTYAAKKIGEYSAQVDKIYNPVFYQAWHFNTSRSGQVDSRIVIMTFMLLAAFNSFDMAKKYRVGSANYSYYREKGLKYLGYALHPIQDYYAHTDDKVYNVYVPMNGPYDPFGFNKPIYIVFKSHIGNNDTDSAIQRWGQVQKTEEITTYILKTFYQTYRALL